MGLVALAALAGCQGGLPVKSGPPARGGTVTEALVGTAGTLNPLFAEEDNARDVDSLVYQGLTTVNASQQVVPLLAKSQTLSADGLTYTYTLRTDVRWADGVPFSLDDVLFTFRVLQDPAYTEATAQFWKEVTVEAAGADAVRFVLKAPSASFPADLRIGILPRHVFDGMPVAAMAADPASNAHAFGTGPFMVQAIAADRKQVSLKRNPRASPEPNLDRFVFRSYPTLADAVDAVSKGEADSVGALQPPQIGALSKRPDLTLHEIRTFGFAAVLFDLTPQMSDIFDPPSVRIALVQAVDRKKIVGSVLEGRADQAPGPIPPTDWAYSDKAANRHPYDPRAAARALDAAGWTMTPSGVRAKGGKQLELALATPDAFPYRQVADAVSQQLGQVGVRVTVNPVPASVLVGQMLIEKQYQLAMVAFDNGPDPDQYSLWHSGAAADSLNFASPLIPRQALIDKDLEDGRAVSDRASRRTAYADFQELMSDAAPAIFLYEPHYAYLVSKRVQGVRTNPVIEPVDRFQHVTDWYVAQGG